MSAESTVVDADGVWHEQRARLVDAAVSMMNGIAALCSQAALAIAEDLNPPGKKSGE
jgi:hypothetical protein